MSLLPDFNEKFDTAIRKAIESYDIFNDYEIGQVTLIELTIRAMKHFLNPDLNPLTFEEVKSWFDRMTEKAGDFQYHGEIVNELGFPCFHYSILCYQGNLHGYREFSIYINEWGFSYSSRTYEFAIFNLLLEECGRHHYNLLSIMKLKPLELFCQMKGYIEF